MDATKTQAKSSAPDCGPVNCLRHRGTKDDWAGLATDRDYTQGGRLTACRIRGSINAGSFETTGHEPSFRLSNFASNPLPLGAAHMMPTSTSGEGVKYPERIIENFFRSSEQ